MKAPKQKTTPVQQTKNEKEGAAVNLSSTLPAQTPEEFEQSMRDGADDYDVKECPIKIGFSKLRADLLIPNSLTRSTHYSITAINQYSIWRLVKKHLDEPVSMFLKRNEDNFDLRLMPTRLSDIGNHRPLFFIDKYKSESFDKESLTRQSVIGIQTDNGSRPGSRLAKIELNLWQWRENMRFATRIAMTELRSNNYEIGLWRSLETIDEIIEFLQAESFKPKTIQFIEKSNERNLGDGKKTYLAKKSRSKYSPYCELCWRYTQWEKMKIDIHPSNPNAHFSKSNRFCEFHDPKKNFSNYRHDLRYKLAFQNEINSLLNQSKSLYAIVFSEPSNEMDSIRKAAYDLVHSQMRKNINKSGDKKSLIEKVFALQEEKLTQSQIARVLGITRQSVWTSFKKIDRLFEIREREKNLNIITGEIVTNSAGIIPSDVLAQIRQWIKEDRTIEYSTIIKKLRMSGTSISIIANDSKYFKHTVATAIRCELQNKMRGNY